eukprot:TRINITY_DN4124_c0_g1_i3.p1 TRINITY_DN4124_c0_g1~~TRINITY_DN4124_c0_g1_i3.p1  ORF type:complete len:296 (-),score=67.19 TRINITY_DN4124_c0_g1_i3:1348-2235(-)
MAATVSTTTPAPTTVMLMENDDNNTTLVTPEQNQAPALSPPRTSHTTKEPLEPACVDSAHNTQTDSCARPLPNFDERWDHPVLRYVSSKRNAAVPMVFHLQKPISVVGRTEPADLLVDSKERPRMISRKHAIITCDTTNGAVTITDCKSLNGIFVNNRKIREATLKDGDVVVFGEGGSMPVGTCLTVATPELKFVFQSATALQKRKREETEQKNSAEKDKQRAEKKRRREEEKEQEARRLEELERLKEELRTKAVAEEQMQEQQMRLAQYEEQLERYKSQQEQSQQQAASFHEQV